MEPKIYDIREIIFTPLRAQLFRCGIISHRKKYLNIYLILCINNTERKKKVFYKSQINFTARRGRCRKWVVGQV